MVQHILNRPPSFNSARARSSRVGVIETRYCAAQSRGVTFADDEVLRTRRLLSRGNNDYAGDRASRNHRQGR